MDRRFARWTFGRVPRLVAYVVAGCIAVLLLTRWVATQPQLAATWQPRTDGQLELVTTPIVALRPHVGSTWVGLDQASVTAPRDAAASADTARTWRPQALLLSCPPRWIVDDAQRRQHQALNDGMAAALSAGPVALRFADDRRVELQAKPPSWSGVGIAFWFFVCLALMLYAASAVVVGTKPSTANALYAMMAMGQAGNLLCMAVGSTASPALPLGYAALDFPLRSAFDLVTLAALAHLACTHPRQLPCARWLPAAAWVLAAATWLVSNGVDGVGAWWTTQSALLVLGCVAVLLMHLSFRSHPHPFTLVMKRFTVVVGGTWLLVSAAVVFAANPESELLLSSASVPLAVTVWQVLFALVLVSVPFLSKSRSMVRELSLFAIISALAMVLDLLFVGVFDMGPFTSLTLALFLSLAVYAGARQWLVTRMLGTRVASTERLFEQLFRTTREVETQPSQAGPALARLLEELFDPFEVVLRDRTAPHAHTLSDGSAMLVPVPVIATASAAGAPASILLRHAQQGRRLFTADDALLADRISEQLRRTVAFDQAVEQGRSEERRRLAQDLHDDIGARLLTLMYKAQSPEMEDYARHTLQDLKTLTRGLAASSQPLSHALAEWKADIAQRLAAAHVELKWMATQDVDVVLTMVQWSGLTRVLRELVSNVMAHAQARHVEIEIHLAGDRLVLSVADDGIGQTPTLWAPGLGLGGVRKRVRQLGGEVSWQQREPQGVECRVTVERLSAAE